MSGESTLVYRRLDSIAQVAGGLALGRSISEAGSVELPYLRVANVQDGYIDTTSMKTVRVLPEEIERYRVGEGDLLLTEGGDFDKLGRGAVWGGQVPVCLHQNHVFRVRPDRDIVLSEYLSLYVASRRGRLYFLHVAKQTTNLATISASQLKAMPIPCPSIHEQRRIVEIMDAATQSEQATQSTIAKLQTIQEGSIAALLGGSGRTGFGCEVDYVACGDVIRMAGGSPLAEACSNPSGRYPIMSSGGLAGKGDREITGRSTIVIGRVGEGAGSVHFVSGPAWVTDNALWVKEVAPGWIPEFLAIYLQWSGLGRFRSQTGQPLITQGAINGIRIPCFDLAEQKRVVRAHRVWEEERATAHLRLSKLRQLRGAIIEDLLSGKARLTAPLGVAA